jgi:hypothetical protein
MKNKFKEHLEAKHWKTTTGETEFKKKKFEAQH